MPFWLPVFDPLTQAQVPGWPTVEFGVYTQRSSKAPLPFVAFESRPHPPNSQRLPAASIQPAAPQREPGSAPVVSTAEQRTWLLTVRPEGRPQVLAAPVVFTGPINGWEGKRPSGLRGCCWLPVRAHHPSPLVARGAVNPKIIEDAVGVPISSIPSPPNSQRFPFASAQPTASWRPPGMLPGSAVPELP